MLHWNFVARHFLKPDAKVHDDLCAPTAWVMDDAPYLYGSTYALEFPIWKSTNPKVDDWIMATEPSSSELGTLPVIGACSET